MQGGMLAPCPKPGPQRALGTIHLLEPWRLPEPPRSDILGTAGKPPSSLGLVWFGQWVLRKGDTNHVQTKATNKPVPDSSVLSPGRLRQPRVKTAELHGDGNEILGSLHGRMLRGELSRSDLPQTLLELQEQEIGMVCYWNRVWAILSKPGGKEVTSKLARL